MPDYGHELQFGVFVPPAAAQAGDVVELAKLADVAGLELVTFQDHPYQPRFLDTWTLLSVVAAETTTVRLAPNVANLPLRPPAVLAKSVASLDLLSGGRVELGLGAGAFWDPIAALGGPRLTPGQSVSALAEAIEVIRALWAADGAPVYFEGEHYRLDGARPGPTPAHEVEIWLGAYRPRMLALTGSRADGWLPSAGYVELEQLPSLNAAIDEAAEEAGRHPTEVRRLFNVNGSFGGGRGFLEGAPGDWAEQLAELTLSAGMSAYILSVASADDLRRFAQEVAPAVRELVDAGRARGPAEPAPAAVSFPEAEGAPLTAVPVPDDGTRLSDERAWDESTRPGGPAPDPERRYTPDQQAAGRHLIDVHDALRAELNRLRDLIEQVARGTADPAAARSFINRMAIRQNNWTLGVFCESYCHVVANHHTLEDRSVFPHLRRSDPELAAVLDRLHEEHEVIAELLERVDGALVELVTPDRDGIDGVRATVDLLTDALLSHFSYEERELVEPLARHGFY
ncbi:MAG TPA: LLM class flavin-dependent oxidoreductase [Thermoleophilaceae bacterium]|jgi:alkanesulfonate monooxygenase SsuD/methylene tetrahydromethanopterin reductase-like flavin-dependent oxidoreductase (luciferase family)